MKKKIGIIGCGAIGQEIASRLDNGYIKNGKLVAVFDINVNSLERFLSNLKNRQDIRGHSDFSEFIADLDDVDIIIECASQNAVKLYLQQIFDLNKEIIVMSVGAFSDVKFLETMYNKIHTNRLDSSYKNSSIHIPSGAIAGIDAIKSAKNLIHSVTLTTTKNPKSLQGAPFFEDSKIDLNTLTTATLLFEGPALEALKLFPFNVNVSAILSLAGIGFQKTLVKIIADPLLNINKHEILVKGDFGELEISVKNVPSSTNPKTSFLAILSAIECLRGLCEQDIRLGT